MNTVIEINGRKYDARTGALLPNDSGTPQTQNRVQKPQTLARPTNMDGVSRRKQPPVTAVPQKATQSATPVAVKQRPKTPTTAKQSLDFKPAQKKTQRANTLLRTVVKKPKKTAPQIHSTSSIAESSVEKSATGRGMLIKRVPEIRLSRAKKIQKSFAISRFTSKQAAAKSPTLKPDLSVVNAPENHTLAAAPAITKPVLGTAQKQQVFVHPVAHATHHNSPRIKKDRLHVRVARKVRINPKILSIGAASFAVVLLLGFLAYQNIPSVAMRVAASQAGFSGTLPGTTPAGFSFKGPIQYGKGFITLNFNSNSDQRKFAITQRPTDWTSEALLTSHILTSNQKYQTYHDKGLTVYIYSTGDATWVDKGVWYSLNGQGALSSEQVLAIAGSM